jgi:hypothetical protein
VSFDQLKFADQLTEPKMATSASTASTKDSAHDAQTSGSAAQAARNSTECCCPDHAVIDITADQLKSMNPFKYNSARKLDRRTPENRNGKP